MLRNRLLPFLSPPPSAPHSPVKPPPAFDPARQLSAIDAAAQAIEGTCQGILQFYSPIVTDGQLHLPMVVNCEVDALTGDVREVIGNPEVMADHAIRELRRLAAGFHLAAKAIALAKGGAE